MDFVSVQRPLLPASLETFLNHVTAQPQNGLFHFIPLDGGESTALREDSYSSFKGAVVTLMSIAEERVVRNTGHFVSNVPLGPGQWYADSYGTPPQTASFVNSTLKKAIDVFYHRSHDICEEVGIGVGFGSRFGRVVQGFTINERGLCETKYILSLGANALAWLKGALGVFEGPYSQIGFALKDRLLAAGQFSAEELREGFGESTRDNLQGAFKILSRNKMTLSGARLLEIFGSCIPEEGLVVKLTSPMTRREGMPLKEPLLDLWTGMVL